MTRPIRIEGDVAYVPLTQGYEAVIDAADVPLVEGWNWTAVVRRWRDGSTKTVYAVRGVWSDKKVRRLPMHRALTNVPDGMAVDHVDCDGINNRRSNLRIATLAQNTRNRRMSNHNKTGMKGVGWRPGRGKWVARIGVNYTRIFLGIFDTAEEAAEAYARASAELHGEFGRLA